MADTPTAPAPAERLSSHVRCCMKRPTSPPGVASCCCSSSTAKARQRYGRNTAGGAGARTRLENDEYAEARRGVPALLLTDARAHMLLFRDVHFARTLVPIERISEMAAMTIRPETI